MTKEDAIESLSLLRIFGAPDLNEAVKMAVSVLQSQADTPPNNPLTLEELREMDGEPVWLEYDECWVFVLVNDGIPMLANLDGERCKAENWMGVWGNIYRRKPEEA